MPIDRAGKTIETYCESAAELTQAGYNAVKFLPIPYTHYDVDRSAVRHTERLLAGVRDAVGEDVDILLDFHGRPASIQAALAYIGAVSPVGPMFVEEPIQPGDPQAMRMVADRAGCPVATGERLLTHKEFEDLCAMKAVTYIQPDLCHCGGLTIGRQIAATAAANGIGVCPHNPMGPVAGVVGLHFGAAVPNFVILEEMSGTVPWYDDVVDSPIKRVDGYWQVPTRPGLGVEINEDEARKHPFQQTAAQARANVSTSNVLGPKEPLHAVERNVRQQRRQGPPAASPPSGRDTAASRHRGGWGLPCCPMWRCEWGGCFL